MSKLTKIVRNSNGTFMKASVTGSKAVRNVLYSGQAKALYVTFKNGDEYRVDGVTARQMTALASAKSIGKYVGQVCRKNGAELISFEI